MILAEAKVENTVDLREKLVYSQLGNRNISWLITNAKGFKKKSVFYRTPPKTSEYNWILSIFRSK